MQHYKPNYKKFGNKGDVVFFLHGYGGDMTSFKKTINTMRHEYKCFAFDLYGFGMTPHPNKKMDIYEYAVQIYLFCVNKNINKLSIVCHSFGGRIAILLSTIFDLKIDKIVMTGSAGLKPRRTILYYIKIWLYKIKKRMNCKKGNKFGSEEYKKLSGYKKESYVAIVNQHLDYLVSLIKSSVLLVWGDRDRSTPMYMYKRFMKGIPNCEGYVFKKSGHFSYLENIYKFNMKVKSFIGRSCVLGD